MELFKKNLLPNLAQLLEIEDRRKKFATLTGMACFLEQRSQAVASSANGIPNQMSAPENASTENSLVNDILSENDRLRQRLTHGTTLTNEPVVNRVNTPFRFCPQKRGSVHHLGLFCSRSKKSLPPILSGFQ
jgi:hypothetical protein